MPYLERRCDLKYIIDIHEEIFIVTYLIICTIFYFIYRRKNRYFNYWCIAAFILYIFALIKITVFPIYVYEQNYVQKLQNEFSLSPYQIIPFKTIKNCLLTSAWKVQIIGNIVLLMPIPLFIGFLSKNFSIKKTLLAGIFTSISIELIQLITNIITQFPNRVADIDDILLNSVGTILGIIVFVTIKKTKLYIILLKITTTSSH